MIIHSIDDSRKVLTTNYQAETDCFLLTNDVDEEFQYYPSIKVLPDYWPGDFDLFILHNDRDDYGENSIYPVLTERRQRIGWIFPIQALESSEHSYSDNEHFLRYAFVAICKLLSHYPDTPKAALCTEIKLSDIYEMNETLLLIDRNNTHSIPGFDIGNYIVSLYNYGYSFTGRGNLKSSCEKNKNLNLVLTPVSNQLKDSKYIVSMYKDIIPNAQDELSQFHLAYQMIEIMIAKVFEKEFKDFLDKVNTAGIYLDLFKAKEDLAEKTSELGRIRRLFSSYTRIGADYKNDLKDACNNLLSHYNACTEDDVANSLYSLRCLIVHRGYMIDSDGIELLESVNDSLYAVIYKMVTSLNI